jgi:hypothetical protein
VLVLLLLTTHQRRIEELWLVGIAATILLTLLWDRQRRKHAWRE